MLNLYLYGAGEQLALWTEDTSALDNASLVTQSQKAQSVDDLRHDAQEI